MICVSVAETSLAACLQRLEGLDFAEVRIDALHQARNRDMRRIFSREQRLIATCRTGRYTAARRLDLLLSAVASGAAYVDIELETEEETAEKIRECARKNSTGLIISHHDFEGTPPRERLNDLTERCFAAGADIAKLACRVREHRDAARLLGLLDDSRSLVVVGMGPGGRIVRAAAPILGSPFTYASPDDGEKTAPGQMDRASMERILNELADL